MVNIDLPITENIGEINFRKTLLFIKHIILEQISVIPVRHSKAFLFELLISRKNRFTNAF